VTTIDVSADELRGLYLDLIKRSLTGALAEDNDTILGGARVSPNSSVLKKAGHAAGRIARQRFNLEIAFKRAYDPKQREQGQDWPSRAESMIGLRRMDNIQQCIATIIADDVPGDLIETGVWRGGACIFMRANLKAWGDTQRKVWVADSFEGLPPPSAKYAADAGDKLHQYSGLAVGLQQVKHNFERYGLLDDRVEFLVGWFKDTLPTAPLDKLALARLDGDMYESTIQAIEALYPRLSPGGFLIIDDFGSHASQAGQAIHDYRKEHGITDEIVPVDDFGAYWRKSG